MKNLPPINFLTSLIVLLVSFSNYSVKAQCIAGTTVSTFDGSTTVVTCPDDGIDDIIKFKPNTYAIQYAFIVTEEDNTILDIISSGNSYNFEGPPGMCRVWGMSYAGVITAGPGDNAATAQLTDFCYELSTNFVEVFRTGGLDIDGGTVAMPSGATTRYTCPGDGNPDVVTFTTTGSTVASYNYVITDENLNILGLPPTNSQDFDGAGEGTCLVWGLSYTGNIIAMPGDNAATTPLTDGCYDLSDNFITVIRSNPEGGMVETINGETQVQTCTQDGMPDVIEFSSNSTSNAQFTYVITDDNNIILGVPPGNSQDFDGAPEGTCRVWGLSYTGNITAMVGDDAAAVPLTDDCYELSSNFIEVNRTAVDGGSVAMPSGATVRYTCPGDGNADIVTFTHQTASAANYIYVITDDNNIILGLPPGNMQDFDGAPAGTCRVWGLSYTGNITANVGDNAAAVPLTDECFSLSSNFIEVIRDNPDGGSVALPGGGTTINTCSGDGVDDIIDFTHVSNSNSPYAYVVTDENNIILGFPPANSQNFEGAPEGTCRVWGLSYTGNVIAQVGDDAAAVPLTDDCFELSSNFIEVFRTGVEGGTVAMPSGATTRYVCVGDGNPDLVTFTTTSTASANYVYVITDENNIILGVPPGNMQDFDGAGVATCRVWGLSYTGNLIAMVGDDAAAVPLSDDCYGLSANFIEVIRDTPEGGMVATDEGETAVITCVGDGIPDVLTFTNSSSSNLNYVYVITDDNNIILGVPPGDMQDFDGAGVATCRVWGLSYSGNITAMPGDDAAAVPLTDDCYELSSNFIEVIRTMPDGATVETDSGEVVIEICVGDGEDDIVFFENSSTSNSNYQYVITDENNIILGLPAGNSQNFEGAGIGVCRVWGLSYTGNITAMAGDDAAAVPLTDDCYELSSNFIEVNRTDDPVVCGPSPSDFGGNGSGNLEGNALQTESNQLSPSEVQLFPNPVSQTLTVKVDYNAIANSTVFVRILDTSGKVVYQNNFTPDQIELDVSNLPDGLFALHLTTNEFSKTKYFVKN